MRAGDLVDCLPRWSCKGWSGRSPSRRLGLLLIDEAPVSQIRLVAEYMMTVDVSTGMSVGSRVCSLPNKYQTDVGKQRAAQRVGPAVDTPVPG